jgi:hypothetical protein
MWMMYNYPVKFFFLRISSENQEARLHKGMTKESHCPSTSGDWPCDN